MVLCVLVILISYLSRKVLYWIGWEDKHIDNAADKGLESQVSDVGTYFRFGPPIAYFLKNTPYFIFSSPLVENY